MPQSGRVTAINQHHGSGKHATVEVTHGKRKRSTGLDGEKGELQSYDQPRSSVVVPKGEAKNYAMGQKVNVHMTPADDDADAGSEPDDDGDEMPMTPSTPAPRKGKMSSKKQKAPPSRGPIFAAMEKRRNRGK